MTESDKDSVVPSAELPFSGKGQEKGLPESPPRSDNATPPSGLRRAFRSLRRELTDEELANTGVQKLLLDAIERSEGECLDLRDYVKRYYEVDKEKEILKERLRSATSIEIAFGVGTALGGAIIGLAPFFWDHQPQGHIALGIGIFLIVAASAIRVIKK